MPLHLLGKKSWNVYNQDNIARVRRDEEQAAAKELAEEQLMQEQDARMRMRQLRGEHASPESSRDHSRGQSPLEQTKPTANDSQTIRRNSNDATYDEVHRRRKRRRGEDDTDMDMRYARRMVEPDSKSGRSTRVVASFKELKNIPQDMPLEDKAGNINLFPLVETRGEGRGKAESTSRSKRPSPSREPYDGTMRFADAAGRHRTTNDRSWYQTSKDLGLSGESAANGMHVWNKEDQGRRHRDAARLAADDPLAAMMSGVRQVRRVEAGRQQWRQEKEAELEEMRRSQGRSHRSSSGHHSHRWRSKDRTGLVYNTPAHADADVEELALDAEFSNSADQEAAHRHEHRHGHDHRHDHRHRQSHKSDHNNHHHHHRHLHRERHSSDSRSNHRHHRGDNRHSRDRERDHRNRNRPAIVKDREEGKTGGNERE